MFQKIILIIFILISFQSCSRDKNIVYEPQNQMDPYELYNDGYAGFERGDYFYASKKFSEAELNFQIVEHAAKSAIMSCYALYGINFYDEALEGLDRFLKKYLGDSNIMYAHYLTAIIYFEQISDEKRDLKPLMNASNKIEFFLKKYPNSEYALDLMFKKDLIQNQLAAKELYLAKYYTEIKKWVPAMNRLKKIVEDYEKTIFIEEALHRLVEIHYYLGLEDEAKKYAQLLGYNFNTSMWFEQSYKILNKDYDISQKIKKKKDKNFLKKIINKIK